MRKKVVSLSGKIVMRKKVVSLSGKIEVTELTYGDD